MSLAGDLDLLVGNYDGELKYIENTGTSTAPVFVVMTLSANPFENIDVGYYSAPALALDGDGTLRQCPLIDVLRLHNVVACAGDLDLIVGNEDGLLQYIEKTRTLTAPVFVARTGDDNPFAGIDVGYYIAPALGDLDGDGTLRPRPSIDKLRRTFCVSRRRPGPRRGQ